MDASHGNETNFGRHRYRKLPRLIMPTLTVVWLGLVGIGLSWLSKYEATPSEVMAPLIHWPVDSRMELNPNRLTLVVFAHPRCPCTRATIGELAIIVARCAERVDVRVVFWMPPGLPAAWAMTDLWASAKAIPGVAVIGDQDGSEAKKFRATTSGYSLLYHPDGQLLFSGGITAARGHSGDNAGRSAIQSLVNGESVRKQTTVVFGCPLFEQNDSGTEGQK